MAKSFRLSVICRVCALSVLAFILIFGPVVQAAWTEPGPGNIPADNNVPRPLNIETQFIGDVISGQYNQIDNDYQLTIKSCPTSGQVLSWDGDSWECGSGGGNIGLLEVLNNDPDARDFSGNVIIGGGANPPFSSKLSVSVDGSLDFVGLSVIGDEIGGMISNGASGMAGLASNNDGVIGVGNDQGHGVIGVVAYDQANWTSHPPAAIVGESRDATAWAGYFVGGKGVYVAGNVGIGTESPRYKAEIVADGTDVNLGVLNTNYDTAAPWSTAGIHIGIGVNSSGQYNAGTRLFQEGVWSAQSINGVGNVFVLDNSDDPDGSFSLRTRKTGESVNERLFINHNGVKVNGGADISGQITVRGGSPATGRVLVSSDVNGLAIWADPGTIIAGGGLPNGTENGQTLRWDGTNWVANSDLKTADDAIVTLKRGDNANSHQILFQNSGNAYPARIYTDGTQNSGLKFAVSDGAADASPTSLTDAMTITNTANVGIGTNAPSSRLHVYRDTGNNSEIDIQSVAGAGNHWGIYSNRSDNSLRVWQGSDRLTILNNGNVGIGSNNPTRKLQVGGLIWSEDSIHAVNNLSAGQNLAASTGWIANQFAIGYTNFTPGIDFDLSGKMRLKDGTESAGRILQSDADGLASWVDPATIAVGGGLPAGAVNETLRHNGTGWVSNGFLANTGSRVGIGTTAPNKELHIKTPAGSNAEIDIQSGNLGHWGIYHDAVTQNLNFWNINETSAGGNALTLDDDGTVGVGTGNVNANLARVVVSSSSSPIASGNVIGLQIANSAPVGADVRSSILFTRGSFNNSSHAQAMISAGSSPTSFGSGYLSFYTNNGSGAMNSAESMRITSLGNVGIGTTNPAVKLDVLGDARLLNQSDLRLGEATVNGSNYTGFQAPALLATDLLYTLPSAQGASSTVLTNNGSGVLSWAPATGGSSYTAGTNIDIASNVISVRPDPTFTGNVTINGSELNHTVNNDLFINSYDDIQLRINSDGAGTGSFRVNNSSNLSVLTVSNSGNVNIEGASGNATVGLSIKQGSAKWNIFTIDPSVGGGVAGSLVFNSLSGDAVTIDPSANVGIGSFTTGGITEKLTVNGNISATGNVAVAGNMSATGYIQTSKTSAGAPLAADCDADAERGRMSIDTTNNRLYVCNGAIRGWDYITLTD